MAAPIAQASYCVCESSMRGKARLLPTGVIEQRDRRDDLARQHREDAVHLNNYLPCERKAAYKERILGEEGSLISGTDLSPYQPSRLPTRGRSTLNCPRHGVLKTCNKAFATEGVLTEC
jgi:hypothetical protein